MAILFFEGLPGAGKSYEAMATQIIPFLKRGKHVVCYIEGLNPERIAEAGGMTLETVTELLHPLTREDMTPREVQDANGKTIKIDGAWIDKTMDNALHVFDEAQNWWGNKAKATDQLTQFVTEHRHRGITVLLMGQSLKDTLALWRRRVDQKFVFLKLTALGMGKRYRVTIFKGQGDDVFVKVADKLNKYDPKYFGTYSSHVSTDTDTETYTDKRVTVFGSTAFMVGIPLVIVMLVFGTWKSWAYFHPAVPPVKPVVLTSFQPVSTGGGPPGQTSSASTAKTVAAPDVRPVQERYFAELSGKSRIRLAGLMEARGRLDGVVEWVDGNTHVSERLSLDQLRDLGVAVVRVRDVVKLALGEWSALATMWPIEAEGKVSEYTQERIRGSADTGLPVSQDARSSAALPGGYTQSPISVNPVHARPPSVAPPVAQAPQRTAFVALAR